MLGMMKGLNRPQDVVLGIDVDVDVDVDRRDAARAAAAVAGAIDARAGPGARAARARGRDVRRLRAQRRPRQQVGLPHVPRAHGQRFALCDKCYGQGLHGKEHELALFERIEEIVVAKCPKLVHETALMRLLRVGICKGNLKKYSFCLTWIADLLLCRQLRDLRARALEISQISPHVRSEFVRLLTELLSKHRRDIELLTEWQPAQNVAAATTNDPSSNASGNSHSHSHSHSGSSGAGSCGWWWWRQ
ncbi:hypothetical protein PINS_up021339 [Pythium insidiosum]|nr:hypothetical protein PINS_up021339 [Pythium insidiosum]